MMRGSLFACRQCDAHLFVFTEVEQLVNTNSQVTTMLDKQGSEEMKIWTVMLANTNQ